MKIDISVARQLLTLFDDGGRVLREYRISTGQAGVGELSGSFQTPRGRHLIRAKIGAGAEENTIFVGRRPTGEVWSPEFELQHPGRDWVLTRILWLSGCEPGRNRLGWETFIGGHGIFVGMDRFGASAPAETLYKHFGITPDSVIERVDKVLERRKK